MKKNKMLSDIGVILLALCIPALMILAGVQTHRYSVLEKRVEQLNESQYEIIEESNRLISDISVLTNSDRIEKIATEELGMRKAESEEIIRVDIKGN
ncbi:MAG: cell division protein FtsL [Treponema sp.]|nr:cell division protein FtsL [Candidatus Treponema caballi]